MSEHQEFTPAPLPGDVRRREMGECIGNSVETAVEHWPLYDYAEGIAMSARTGLWFRHAWNVADDGIVIDSTWGSGLRYIGRVVPLDDVIAQAQDRQAYWYMDEQDFPFVPEGETGMGCWTKAQWEWIQGRMNVPEGEEQK